MKKMATKLMSDSSVNDLHKLFLKSYNFQKSFLGSAEVALSTYVTQSFKKLRDTGNDENEEFQWEIQCLRNPCVNPQRTHNEENGPEKVLSLMDALLQRVMDKDDSVACFVVLGDSGMGKTTLALSLMEKIWRESKENKILHRVPIYIHLPAEFRYLKDVSLKTFLAKNHFSPNAINEILNQPLLLFLDGFDEFHTTGNIYEQISTGLSRTDAKVVILSRLDELPADRSSRAKLFQPPRRDFNEYVLEPFDSSRINQYIVKFTTAIQGICMDDVKGTLWELAKISADGTEWIGNPEMYITWIDKVVELSTLAQNPFLLSLILLTLPKIVQSQDGKQTNVRKLCSTRVGIFDSFTDNWFMFQAQKLVDAEVAFSHFGVSTIQRYFRAYAQNVAHSLIQDNGFLCDDPIQVDASSDITFLQPAFDEDLLRHFEKHKHFLEKCDAISVIRRGCLAQFRENEFRFFHRSLAEYFAARELFDGVQGEFDCHLNNIVSLRKYPRLNRQLIQDKQLLLQLAERVNLDDEFSENLFNIIRQSSEHSSIALMSSNSITILNLAGKSLSGENFQKVQIPNANLSQSLCGNTDFRGANLTGVLFHDSWLVKSKFQGAIMKDVDFGESQAIDNTHIVFDVLSYSNDKSNLLLVGSIPPCAPMDGHATAFQFVVTFWNLSTGKKKNQIKHKENEEFKPHFQICGEDILVTCGNVVKFHSIKTGSMLSKVVFPDDPFIYAFLNFNLSWICCLEEKSFRIHKLSKNFKVDQNPMCTYVQEVPINRLALTIHRLKFGRHSDKFVIAMNRIIKIIEFPREGDEMLTISSCKFDFITSIAIDSHDTFCCLGSAKRIGVLDMTTGDIVEEIKEAHGDQINCLEFNTDSTLLASGSDDFSVKLWKYDLETGKKWEILKHFHGFESVVISVAFCHENDKSLAAVMHGDKKVKIFNVAKEGHSPFTGAKSAKRFIVRQNISRRKSENFPFFIVVSLYDLVEVFDICNGKVLYKFQLFTIGFPLCLHILSANAFLIIDKNEKLNTHIYNECGEIIGETHIYVKKNLNAEAIILLNDEQYMLAWTLDDGSIQLFDISFELSGANCTVSCSPKILLQAEEFGDDEIDINRSAISISFNKSGTTFGSSGWGTHDDINIGVVRIWDISTGQMIRKIESDCYMDIKFYSDYFAACGEFNGKIKFRSVSRLDGQHSHSSISGLGDDRTSFDISEELNLIVATSVYQPMLKSLHVYDLTTHKLVLDIPLWFLPLYVFIFSSNISDSTSSSKGYVLLTEYGENCGANIACIELSLTPDKSWTWKLLWSSLSKCILLTDDLQMEQSFNLSQENQNILALSGANGIAAPCEYPFISWPLLFKPLIGTSFSYSSAPLIKMKLANEVTLECNKWVVTAAISQKPFQLPHVFLILEGVYNNRRFLVRGDLTYNRNLKQVVILTSPKKMDFIEKVKNLKGNQWTISPRQGITLLQNIMADKQRRLTTYNFQKQNCVAWVRDHLQSIGLPFNERWYNSVLVLPSNVLK